MTNQRIRISPAKKNEVLMEAGYRCAVPTCRNILAIDLHHIIKVSEKGGNDVTNLIALCGTCHDLYHKGVIRKDAIYNWKGLLIALNQAFDSESVDLLIFLCNLPSTDFKISGDGVLKFARLISSGLASFEKATLTGTRVYDGIERPSFYNIHLTPKGKMLVDAWIKGDRTAVKNALSKD